MINQKGRRKKLCEGCREITVSSVFESTSNTIDNISDHKGITLSHYLRTELSVVVSGFPDSIKNTPPKPCEKQKQIRIRGVGNKLIEQLNNIAGHLGVNAQDYVAVKIAEAAFQQPQNMKTEMIQ